MNSYDEGFLALPTMNEMFGEEESDNYQPTGTRNNGNAKTRVKALVDEAKGRKPLRVEQLDSYFGQATPVHNEDEADDEDHLALPVMNFADAASSHLTSGTRVEGRTDAQAVANAAGDDEGLELPEMDFSK